MNNLKIGIIGGGTMGNGIAHVFSIYNFNVILVDINATILGNAKSHIEKNMNRQLKKGYIDIEKLKSSLDRILFSTDINDVKDCDLVIEAVKEDIDIKNKIFKQLDKLCKNSTILASNSALSSSIFSIFLSSIGLDNSSISIFSPSFSTSSSIGFVSSITSLGSSSF